jgi:CRISPR-associated protein Cas1
MREALNTLYVHTQGTRLRLEGDALRADVEGALPRRMPLLRLEAIVVFGSVGVTSDLIYRCANDGRTIVWMTRSGRFAGRLQGPTSGNVLLRIDQHRTHFDETARLRLAKMFVADKVRAAVQFARDLLRYHPDEAIPCSPSSMKKQLSATESVKDIDELLGIEGYAARLHFSNLRSAMRTMPMGERSRRPPLDPPNAVLGFLYGILRGQCVGALEAVGLDPQIGFLHSVRPGRPALALDLMEEFRPIVDRLCLTLCNRRQLTVADFERELTGAYSLNENGRRTVIRSWQEHNEREVRSTALRSRQPFGLIPHVQARILARVIRGDLSTYIPHG